MKTQVCAYTRGDIFCKCSRGPALLALVWRRGLWNIKSNLAKVTWLVKYREQDLDSCSLILQLACCLLQYRQAVLYGSTVTEAEASSCSFYDRDTQPDNDGLWVYSTFHSNLINTHLPFCWTILLKNITPFPRTVVLNLPKAVPL